MHSALLLLATIALLAPAVVSELEFAVLAILLMVAYGLGLLFALKTHKEFFESRNHGEGKGANWSVSLAVGTLLVVTVLVAPAVLWIVRTRRPRGVTFRRSSATGTLFSSAIVTGSKRTFSPGFSRPAPDTPDMKYVIVDATIVKVHRHGQGTKKGLRARPSAVPKAA
jgi:Ca2+:H+ antiporter